MKSPTYLNTRPLGVRFLSGPRFIFALNDIFFVIAVRHPYHPYEFDWYGRMVSLWNTQGMKGNRVQMMVVDSEFAREFYGLTPFAENFPFPFTPLLNIRLHIYHFTISSN